MIDEDDINVTANGHDWEKEAVDLRKTRRRKNRQEHRAVSSMIDRLPPHDIESESGVLGCVFLSPHECVGHCIEAFEDGAKVFYDLRHQVIYELFVEMYGRKEAIDVITVQRALKDKHQLEAVGGIAYLATLPDTVPSAANISYYTAIVLEKYLLRKMIGVCTDVVSRAYEHEGKIDELIEGFEHDALSIRRTIKDGEQSESKPLVHEVMEELENIHERKGALAGLSTGFPDLDKITWGLQKTDMIVIAARPSVGKSSLAMNIADAVAVEQKIPVGVFSLEMSKKQLMMRMVCSRARVNIRNIHEGFFSERDYPKITTAAGKLAAAPLVINDQRGMTILQLRAKARRMQQEYGTKLFIIDYLTLLHGYSRKAETNRQVEVSEVSNGIKEMAGELDVPVIVLAQLGREFEKGKRPIPILADLKESGAIEQDADLVGLLYKPKDDADDETVQTSIPVNMAIAKQRNGATGMVYLTFLKQFTKFESTAKISDDHPLNPPD